MYQALIGRVIHDPLPGFVEASHPDPIFCLCRALRSGLECTADHRLRFDVTGLLSAGKGNVPIMSTQPEPSDYSSRAAPQHGLAKTYALGRIDCWMSTCRPFLRPTLRTARGLSVRESRLGEIEVPEKVARGVLLVPIVAQVLRAVVQLVSASTCS